MSLNKELLETQKKALLVEKNRLEAEIKALSKYPDYGDMSDDNDMEVRDYSTRMSEKDQMGKLLKKVEESLKAIEKGTYGQCSICRREIDEDRLGLAPFADICVACSKNASKK